MKLFKHYKSDATYEVISDTALIEATKERAVVYRLRNGDQVWVRPYSDFHALVEVLPTKPGPAEFVPRFAECSVYPHLLPNEETK